MSLRLEANDQWRDDWDYDMGPMGNIMVDEDYEWHETETGILDHRGQMIMRKTTGVKPRIGFAIPKRRS